MLLGQRVRLQGLVRASNLNGQLGTVEEAGAERATVRLDSGRSISAKLENITSLVSQNRSSGASSSSDVQPAGASGSGAEQPTMTLGASEFAAATNGLGASPFSLAPMPVANARAVSMPPMAWGSANPDVFESLDEKNRSAGSLGI